MLLLTIEDEMAVEVVGVDNGEIVAPNPAVDELGRFTLLVPLISVDGEMLVASTTEDDATVVDDITNSVSVTDG